MVNDNQAHFEKTGSLAHSPGDPIYTDTLSNFTSANQQGVSDPVVKPEAGSVWDLTSSHATPPAWIFLGPGGSRAGGLPSIKATNSGRLLYYNVIKPDWFPIWTPPKRLNGTCLPLSFSLEYRVHSQTRPCKYFHFEIKKKNIKIFPIYWKITLTQWLIITYWLYNF